MVMKVRTKARARTKARRGACSGPAACQRKGRGQGRRRVTCAVFSVRGVKLPADKKVPSRARPAHDTLLLLPLP